MSTRTSYAPGTPSWVDLMAPDREQAKAFYGSLFGWTFEDSTDPDSGAVIYTNCSSQGKQVAGIGGVPPGAEGVPPVWSSYISVTKVEETLAKVEAAGGTVMMPAMDIMDVGRMAIFADPTGAMLSLWQPKAHIGASLVNEPYGFSWNELNTRDIAAATAFYPAVFGWTVDKVDGPMEYYEWKLGGDTIAGMMPVPEMVPAEVPSHWMVYFAVEDCDASLAKITDLGGGLLAGPMDIPIGRFAVVMDPAGAPFTVMHLHETG